VHLQMNQFLSSYLLAHINNFYLIITVGYNVNLEKMCFTRVINFIKMPILSALLYDITLEE
jgi:hypothetical protein